VTERGGAALAGALTIRYSCAHRQGGEQEEQNIVVPKHECRGKAQECKLGPGVQ
jgi:hypothetical protein